MTRYQKVLFNKITNLTNALASDYESRAYGCKGMSRKERQQMEAEREALTAKFQATYK